MKSAYYPLLLISLYCFSVVSAHATVIQLTDASALSASDTTLIFPDADTTQYTTGTVSYATGNNTVTFTGSDTLTRYIVGSDYSFSAFADGTNILMSSDGFGANDPVTLSFATGVSELGFNLEDPSFSDYNVTFTAYNGTNALGTFTASGNDPNTLSFIGLNASGGDVITSLLVSDDVGNNLAFGPITFASSSSSVSASVPEPTPLALLGIGLFAIAGIRSRRSI